VLHVELERCAFPGTLVKQRTIPHSPCSSLLFKGFPAIKNLGHFDSRQDRILLIKKKIGLRKLVVENPQIPQFRLRCGNCGLCGIIVDFVE
jgi:hypothetical protein